MSTTPQLGVIIVHLFFLLCTRPIIASIATLYTLKRAFCTFTLLHDKHMLMKTPITCDNNPRNNVELNPASDDHDFYILSPEPIKRKPPLMFTPSQIKNTKRPNTFTAQDAGIIFNAELSKHCDTTLQFLTKALSFSLISSNNPDYDAKPPQYSSCNALRFGLHNKLPNLTPLVTPTRFSDAFI